MNLLFVLTEPLFFLATTKRFPTWVDSSKNGQYCIVGYLPYVRCTRSFWSKVKDAAHLSPSCRYDSDCLCETGCPGVSLMGEAHIFKPTCYKRGWNRCMCALQSTQVKSKEGCKYPTAHKTKVGSMDINIYYAKEGNIVPTKKSGWFGH